MKSYTTKDITKHPFELIFAENNPKFLVIGSFPTTDLMMSFKFFYTNANNKFWKVLSEVFTESKTKLTLKVSVNDTTETKEQNKTDRQNFCRENKIAMTDMLASCIRLNGNSKDEQLLVHSYNNVLDILKQNKSIDRIILTAKSSGASAHHHFYQYLSMNGIEFDFDSNGGISKGKIKIDDRIIKIFSMDSTSSRNSHVTDDGLIKLYKEAFNQCTVEQEKLNPDINIMKVNLFDLDISVQLMNGLKAANVRTIGDLMELNQGSLLSIKNFGRKSLNELNLVLRAYHLSIKNDRAS